MAVRLSGKLRIAIVGAGNLASALAPSLRAAGYRIDEVISRNSAQSLKRARKLAGDVGARTATVREVTTRDHTRYRKAPAAQLRAEIVWFCVPDGEIANSAKSLLEAADWQGKIALHSSGALTSDEFDSLRKIGASVASVHPLMTFVRGSRPALAGVPFALEGDARAVRVARSIVAKLRGEAFLIRKQEKQAYHAWGMFSSPLITALLSAAELVAGAAKIRAREARNRMLPILRQTLSNYERLGAPGSFSGPIARGDVKTVEKHLKVLQEVSGARDVYIALAQVALRTLPARNRANLEKTLVSKKLEPRPQR